MLLHNYTDSNTYPINLVKSNLTEISIREIQSIKKRIDFYINHYKISTKAISSISSESKLVFLLNINNMLENEIKNRYTAGSFHTSLT